MITIIELTLVLRLLTGLFSLFYGDFSKRTLKFAAVSLSTAAALIACLMMMLENDYIACQAGAAAACATSHLYILSSNIAFIFFHAAIARDANRFRIHDRRAHRAHERGEHERHRKAA